MTSSQIDDLLYEGAFLLVMCKIPKHILRKPLCFQKYQPIYLHLVSVLTDNNLLSIFLTNCDFLIALDSHFRSLHNHSFSRLNSFFCFIVSETYELVATVLVFKVLKEVWSLGISVLQNHILEFEVTHFGVQKPTSPIGLIFCS